MEYDTRTNPDINYLLLGEGMKMGNEKLGRIRDDALKAIKEIMEYNKEAEHLFEASYQEFWKVIDDCIIEALELGRWNERKQMSSELTPTIELTNKLKELELRIRALETTKENEKVCEECGYPYKEYDIDDGYVFYKCENKTCGHFINVRSKKI